MLKNAIAIPAGLVAVVSFRVYVSARLFSVAVVSSLRGAPFLELVMPFTGPEAKKIRRNNRPPPPTHHTSRFSPQRFNAHSGGSEGVTARPHQVNGAS